LVYCEAMQKTIVIEKREGETPLEALMRARQIHGIPEDVPMTYAGRLDPMASGKLLLLLGDECMRQRNYHGLDKAYRFEILFGFQSDTGDILGMPEAHEGPAPEARALRTLFKSLHGPISLPYPRFSSKTVSGKPLFLWTLEGRLGEIEMPVAHTRIHALRYHGMRRIPYAALKEDILRRLRLPTTVTEERKKLGEDFRRKDITPAWEGLLTQGGDACIASCEAVVSTGTYIRALAPHIAQELGAAGLAYSIERTRIGRYLPFLSTGLWTTEYR
jgi:tRNA pseudouridine(55) synthase